ncbi:cytochrome P450 4V2 [Caerostris extrusa]|uniref:Cytochrome P450 4V2 n=1 Tax=Caerostris extrusa TaxID=172846 RepID=A0AAV4N323_CAEEX|nr:cytochrome P450 4V2 [Caerostris extrusa]
MFFVIVVYAFIGIVAVLAILTLWRKKYSRFVPDNKHSVFQVLVDAMDSILFVTSGKKNALHLYILKYFREKSKKFRRQPLFTHWLCGVPLVVIHKAEAVKDLLKEKRITQKVIFMNSLSHVLRMVFLHVERAKEAAPPCFQSSMLKGYITVFNEHAQKLVEFLHEETGKEFTCVERPISLCSLDILCESILGVKIGALQSEAEEYVSSLQGMPIPLLY